MWTISIRNAVRPFISNFICIAWDAAKMSGRVWRRKQAFKTDDCCRQTGSDLNFPNLSERRIQAWPRKIRQYATVLIFVIAYTSNYLFWSCLVAENMWKNSRAWHLALVLLENYTSDEYSSQRTAIVIYIFLCTRVTSDITQLLLTGNWNCNLTIFWKGHS